MGVIATMTEPGSDRRRTLVVDSLIAAGFAVLSIVGTYFASEEPHAGRIDFDVGAAVLAVVAALALALRRRRPLAVLVVVFAATLAYFTIGYADGPIWLSLIFALVNAVIQGHRLAAVVTAAIGFLVFPWLDLLVRDGPAPEGIWLLALAAWLLVWLGVAELIRIRRERRADALRMQEEERMLRAGEERLRIARELHDALGHHLSLISVQAGVALHLNEALPDQALTSLTAIRDASKEALTELRSVLEILRQQGEAAPRFPGSTLARIEDLAAQASAAGLEVNTEVSGEARPLPYGIEAAAFRIVQEALTNVTKHARAASVSVRVAYGDEDLSVEVEDDGRGSSMGGSPAGSGKGIVGMRERVAALGGELETGLRPEGGFRVRAVLPLEVART